MSCEDIPSLLDLQKVKKNADDFGRLMGIGGGTSTNGVTGQVRPTYNAVMSNLGYTRVGTFATGATLLNGRQTLLWDIADGGDGQEYGWSGSFPPSGKVVPPGSTPLTTGGISVGAWMSRFDPELRTQVREVQRRSYAEAGYNLVAGSFEAGGILVNSNDVLLQENTGKAFSGPAGTVPSGSEPNNAFIEVEPIVVVARTLETLLAGKAYGAKIVGMIDISSPIELLPTDTIDAFKNDYRGTKNGLRLTTKSSQAVAVKRYATGGRIQNLAITHVNNAKDNDSVGFDLNVLDTPVETSGVGAVCSDVYVNGFSKGVKISGWAWHVRMTRVLTDKCVNGFVVLPSSTNLLTLDQCIALLGSHDSAGPTSSIGYYIEGSYTVNMLNCASEANYINCKFKDSDVVFDVFYSESAALQDFNLNGGTLTGHTLRVMPSAPKFANSSVFRVDVGASSPRVRITNMIIAAGTVNIDAVFDLNEESDIIIDYINTKDCNYNTLFYSFKKSPRKVGFKNPAGARWYLEKSGASTMIPVVELRNLDPSFSFTTETRSGVKDYKSDGAKQITDNGVFVLVGSVWRNADSSRAGTILQNTSSWVDRKIVAGQYYVLSAVNYGQGTTGSCYLAGDGAVNGDRVVIRSDVGMGQACNITVKNLSVTGTVIATVSAGTSAEFVFDGTNWIRIG